MDTVLNSGSSGSKFPEFKLAQQSAVSVTRAASIDSTYVDVATGTLGASKFLAWVRAPASSPAFIHMLPFLVVGTAGAIWKTKRALYDPTTGVVRFFVESSGSGTDPSWGTAETWSFGYQFLFDPIPT